MNNIINVTGGQGGNAFLVLGKDKTALIDSGMAYCAHNLISNIKRVLFDGRKLDYILLSHSHYDHIGAVPYLKKAWPDVTVLAAEYAQYILTKKSALQTIKKLSKQAAIYYGANQLIDYDDNLMKIDCKISEGDSLDLGGVIITVLETPGHTKCSLSFLVNNEVLFVSETAGVISQTGKIHPGLLNSYKETMKSIKKCQKANPKYIVSPHFGFVGESESANYWEKSMEAANKCRDFVLKLFYAGADEDTIFKEFQNVFLDEHVTSIQTGDAFEINSRAMIKTIINEE